jgi:hypothetical protein
VSAHVRELLSAYLDDELVPADRAAIDLHLRDCAECARHLAEVAAVDALARALPAEAPEGYFDDFSARVRARVEAPAPARTKQRFPIWTLAAAAGLLLAVLTPTLVRKQSMTPPASPAPAATDAFAVATPAEPQQGGRVVSEATPPATLAQGAVAAKKLTRSRGPEIQAYNAVEQDRAKEQGALAKQAPKDVVVREEPRALGYVEAPQEKLKAESRDDAPAASSRPELVSEEAVAPVAPPAPAMARAQAALQEEVSPGKAAAASELRGGALASEAETKTAARRQNQTVATPLASPFQELLDRRVSTAAEARSLREAWRAHALSSPASEADEARVRAIEAGALAVKLSGQASDLAQLRKDVADYVARADALQAKRARAALRSAEAAGR